jgi:2-polyprenyl-6-methoxyphenol hydroxylase-like FAD-dependent oxidoreductase
VDLRHKTSQSKACILVFSLLIVTPETMISVRIPYALTRRQEKLLRRPYQRTALCKYFSSGNGNEKERMRIAIVGGGAAGLSSALHLAPLVASGSVEGPIDIYDVPGPQRGIGVGIWSTALDPFRASSEESHKFVIEEFNRKGRYLSDVGYRTPNGDWLARSRLGGENMPDLIFIREMDMLDTLHKAVQLEEERGTVKLYSGTDYQVQSVAEDSSEPWSAGLWIGTGLTDRDYHLIVAADGMNSTIRKMYGGYVCERSRLTGTAALNAPMDLSDSNDTVVDNWHTTGQAVATSTQDRNYTVFRGVSHLSNDEIGLNRSFQTWGEGQSMRFATVPLTYPTEDGSGGRKEREVWFITIDKDEIIQEPDPAKRRDLLLKEFETWHDPIRQLVEATPPDEILMERALAHKHSMTPVVNFNEIITRIRQTAPPSTGNGPAIAFIGDAYMCVDPILAQGFTFSMEGAALLKTALDASLITTKKKINYLPLDFDPFQLRQELKGRHDGRLQRLICLLRATEMVQALGQPTSGTIIGFMSKHVIRTLMRVTPDIIKTPIFNAVAKYSLGLPQNFQNEGQ